MRSVCVFSGSTRGNNPVYADAAATLGRELAARGIRLIYGGGSVGLMGIMADAALAAGGQVVGVIPEHLLSAEVGHHHLSEMHVTASMHERKALMAELADAFIAIPGGFGTLEEAIEILTWSQLGLHQKPLGFLNVAGFYTPLLAYFEELVTHGFVREHNLELYVSAAEPVALLTTMMATHRPDTDTYFELT